MRETTAVVTIREDDQDTYLEVRDPDGRLAALCLNYVAGDDPGYDGQSFLNWAGAKLDHSEVVQNKMQVARDLESPTEGDLPRLTDTQVQLIWEGLTNGIGEKPYSRLIGINLDQHAFENGYCEQDEIGGFERLMIDVFVGNNQLMCTVDAVSEPAEYEDIVASAICNAGRAIKQLREERDEAIGVLRDLNDVRSLGDLCYSIREREGKGWDGPEVTKWGKATERMRKLLDLTEVPAACGTDE